MPHDVRGVVWRGVLRAGPRMPYYHSVYVMCARMRGCGMRVLCMYVHQPVVDTQWYGKCFALLPRQWTVAPVCVVCACVRLSHVCHAFLCVLARVRCA